MATYTYFTLGQAKLALALRLGDSHNKFWSSEELGVYLIDALRTWGASTMCFRDRGYFPTVSGQSFYDPTDLLVDGTGVQLLDKTITNRNLINELQYHLIESVNDWDVSSSWNGTEMFSMGDLTEAVQRRRNQFLLETGQIQSVTKYAATAGDEKISLPDDTIDIRRVAWIDLTSAGVESTYTGLWRTDDFQLSQFSVGWNLTPDVPISYAVTTVPETFIRVSPPPIASGKIHVLSVNSGSDLDPDTGIELGIMNNWTHVVKWGALADLLSRDGPSKDEDRAKYCEERWRDGLKLAQIMSTILSAQINGNYIQICSLFDLDAAYPNWQSTSGSPEVIALSGASQIGLYSVPDGVYSIVLDVVRNSIVPTLDEDYIQVGREYLDTILDYAQHLAAFKQGGKEFLESVELYKRFLTAASRYNDRLSANAHMLEALSDNISKEESQRPRVEVRTANG